MNEEGMVEVAKKYLKLKLTIKSEFGV